MLNPVLSFHIRSTSRGRSLKSVKQLTGDTPTHCAFIHWQRETTMLLSWGIGWTCESIYLSVLQKNVTWPMRQKSSKFAIRPELWDWSKVNCFVFLEAWGSSQFVMVPFYTRFSFTKVPCKTKVDVTKYHACHARCRGVTGDRSQPKRATRASPVPQVPRLPHKTKVDVTKCHACHAKCRGVTGD